MGAVFPNYRRLLASYNHCRLRKKRCRIPRIPSCCPFERETRGPVLLQPEHHSDSDACCIALVVTDGATRWPESRRSLRTRAHPGCRRAIETLPSTREARPCGHRDLLQARWPTGEFRVSLGHAVEAHCAGSRIYRSTSRRHGEHSLAAHNHSVELFMSPNRCQSTQA